jgi:kinesin family protein 4/21/27
LGSSHATPGAVVVASQANKKRTHHRHIKFREKKMEPPDDATSSHEGSVSVKVAVRARPLSSSEKAQGCRDILHLHRETVDAGGENRTFDYDYVFGTGASQADIYEQTTVPLLNRVFEGFNATILAYGQTGSGKTFTMGTAFGGNGGADADASAGIVPRAVHELFARRARMASHRKVDVRLSFLEIHHEEIHDLLAPSAGAAGHGDGFETAKPSGHGLAVRESTEGAIVVAGLSSHTVATAADVERLLAVGTVGRATGSTAMNAASSRSHAVCTLTLEVGFAHSDAADDGAVEHVGKLTLVDLAGSERAKRTGASGNRLKEGISINRGLVHLGTF